LGPYIRKVGACPPPARARLRCPHEYSRAHPRVVVRVATERTLTRRDVPGRVPRPRKDGPVPHALRIHPDRDAFERLAAEHPLVPCWAELLADARPPVGLFPAVAGGGPGILLESVERSERWGRYSFVAGDPAAVLVVDASGLHLRDVVRELPTGEPSRRLTPREALRASVHRLRAPRLEGLPPITAGLMGYLAYAAATLLDGHPAPHADDAPYPPIALLPIDHAV